MPPRFQPVQNPEDSSPGIRSFHAHVPMDPATGGPSGARITPITVGSDTTGRMKKLFVANFPLDTSEPELRRHFEQVGEVVDVAIKRDRNGMPGIAFVTFTNESDARTGSGEISRRDARRAVLEDRNRDEARVTRRIATRGTPGKSP